MVTVFPGTELTRAKDFRLNSLFKSEDLPTLERPEKAISGKSDGGSWENVPNAASKSAFFFFFFYLSISAANFRIM